MTQSTLAPAYYRHSGKITAPGLIAGLITAVVAGAALGFLMGFLTFWIYKIPSEKLHLLVYGCALIGTGALLGFLPALVMKRFKGRSPLVAMTAATLATAVALYFAWVAWIMGIILYLGEGGEYLAIFRPDILYSWIGAYYEHGFWHKEKEQPTTGNLLLACWIIEAAALFITALLTARANINSGVFCETCNAWGAKRPLTTVASDDAPELETALKSANLDALSSARAPQSTDTTWFVLSLEGCPSCDNLQALNVERTTISTDKKGNVSTAKKDILKRLLLSPEQTAQLAILAATLVPAPESAPTPVTPPVTPPPITPAT